MHSKLTCMSCLQNSTLRTHHICSQVSALVASTSLSPIQMFTAHLKFVQLKQAAYLVVLVAFYCDARNLNVCQRD